MRVIGIDPGTYKSGYVVFARAAESRRVAIQENGEMENEKLLLMLRRYKCNSDGANPFGGEWIGKTFFAIENIEGMGFVVGKTTFDTCIWIGRFIEAWENNTQKPSFRISRGDERIVLCGCSTFLDPETGKRHKVSDGALRKALIERFPDSGGGKVPQIGVKANPGPLYGMSGHAWQALSVAVTFSETHDEEGREIAGFKASVKKKKAETELDPKEENELGI